MSVLSPSTACTITSPPLPPSPPFGPPNSMNFSRRNDTQPFPPSPERTYTLASSRNFMTHDMRARMQKYESAHGWSARAALKEIEPKTYGKGSSRREGPG